MTVQPNDRKQELTPEFQDEASKRANPARGKESRRAGTGRAATDRTATDQSGSEGTANDRTADDRTAGDRAADDRAVDVATATDKTATDRAADQAGAEGSAAERAGAEREGTDRAGAGAVANKDRTEVAAQADKKPGTQDRNRHHATDDAKRPENQAPVAARTRLFEEQDVTRYREQWRELQAGFVDEPRGAVREAETLVSQMMETLTAQLNEQKRALAGNAEAVDTEQLRVTMQRYRSLFDQMLSV